MKGMIASFIIVMFTIADGQASQCHILPKKQAKKAISILTRFKKLNPIAVIDIYCEACRDLAPKPVVIDSVTKENFQVNGFEKVLVNNQKIDLAYTYINGENVANMIGCQATGVAHHL